MSQLMNGMNREKLSLEMVNALYAPLPPEALKPHPTKEYLSSVKAIFVVERLNEVFGIGGWTYRTRVIEATAATQVPDDRKPGTMKDRPGMVVMHVELEVPEYGIRLEQYGGSDNADRGDAYKGAVTDALSKIASYLGIAIDVYKGGGPTKQNPRGMAVAQSRMTEHPALNTQAAADKVAREKIAAGTAAVINTPREKQPAPWSNRGEMKRAFGRIRERVGEVSYLTALGKYGTTAELNWKSAAQALECYERLTEIAVDQAS